MLRLAAMLYATDSLIFEEWAQLETASVDSGSERRIAPRTLDAMLDRPGEALHARLAAEAAILQGLLASSEHLMAAGYLGHPEWSAEKLKRVALSVARPLSPVPRWAIAATSPWTPPLPRRGRCSASGTRAARWRSG